MILEDEEGLPDFATFETDKPLRVKSAKVKQVGELTCTIEWYARPNGF